MATLTRAEKRHGTLTAGSYRGVSYKQVANGRTEPTFGAVGHFVVLAAAPSLFDEIVDASKGSGLEGQPAFTTAMAALPSSSLIRGYANGPQFVGGLESLPTVSAQVKRALQAAASSGKLRGALSRRFRRLSGWTTS